MHDMRRAPPPEFAARLRARLHAQRPAHHERWRTPVARWLAAAAAVAAVGFAFTFPDVRAGAAAFLDLFRVVNFAGVRFDPQRLAGLKAGGVDLPSLLGDVEPLAQPGAPVSYADPVEAGRAASIDVRLPAWVPPGWTLAETVVAAEHSVRVTANAAKLQAVLDTLALNDVRLPEGLDGQVATVTLPPVVGMTYRSGDVALHLFEARSAEVSFPAGFDLPALAHAALRILGLDRDEAYRMAYSIDWRSTLIVPVPADAASFRPANVAGADGLLIERARGGSVLLWSAGGRMYALSGPLGADGLLEMAQSLQ
ncbi:MAG TPA: hypothetical protein VHH11_03905 [Gammaproteobacteria bacterium]|nr:hypothetical protein [Gammaproteobacteria bacterium]